jgi:hypothetical protein
MEFPTVRYADLMRGHWGLGLDSAQRGLELVRGSVSSGLKGEVMMAEEARSRIINMFIIESSILKLFVSQYTHPTPYFSINGVYNS